MNRILMRTLAAAVLVASAMLALDAMAQDRAKVVPGMKVLMENECVRVQYHDVAVGQTAPMHSHPNYIVYTLKPFKARVRLADGSQRNQPTEERGSILESTDHALGGKPRQYADSQLESRVEAGCHL